jgi:hypothetical protein
MMTFKYKNKQYELGEPTVEMWSKLVLLQEWTDEREFSTELLAFSTGLTPEEIENSDYEEVIRVSQEISQFLLQEGDKFHHEIDFDGKKYRFLDLANLTFGEFIDIDTYLAKEPHEKKKEMSLLMAMLYRELDENGNYKPYNSKELQIKAEQFKKLPVRYVKGASNFFFRLERTLQGNFQVSFLRRMKLTIKMIWVFVKLIPLISSGVGSVLWFRWQTKTLPRLKKLLHIR